MATTELSYTVKGMTCNSCKLNVTQEVEQVQGVSEIEVEIETGRLTVRGEGVSDDAVKAAVGEAGYEVVVS